MTAAFDALKAALAASAEIERQAHEHDAQAADLAYAAERDEAEAARIENESEGAAADALLAGKTAPARADSNSEKLRQEAKIKSAAAEKARVKAAEVAAGYPAAQAVVTSAALGFMRGARDEARADLAAALITAVEPLARMIAADRVRQHLVGDRYSFDPREHDPGDLWSGAVLADKLIKGIPPRLRPEDFAEAIRDRAEEIAADILRKLTEEHA